MLSMIAKVCGKWLKVLGLWPLFCLLVSAACLALMVLGYGLHACGFLAWVSELVGYMNWFEPLRALVGLVVALGLVVVFCSYWAFALVAFVLSGISIALDLHRRLNVWVLLLSSLPFLAEWLGWW